MNNASGGYPTSFALALYDLMIHTSRLEPLYAEVKLLLEVLALLPDLPLLLDDRTLPFAKKEHLLRTSFGSLDPLLLNSMLLLAQRCRFCNLRIILSKLKAQLAAALGVEEGIVYSAQPLRPDQLRRLEAKLSQRQATTIHLVNHTDRELIGGFRITIGDTIWENSVRAELAALKQKLLDKTKGDL